MFKHILALLLLTTLIILGLPYVQTGLQGLLHLHEMVADALTQVFSSGDVGNLTRKFISLLAIPLLGGLIPAFFYWLFRKHWFPQFMTFVWVIWLIQTSIVVIQG